jgi:hypothetical protein
MARYISQGQARRSLMLRRPARVAKASGSTSRRPEPRRTEVVVFGPCRRRPIDPLPVPPLEAEPAPPTRT